MARDVYERWRWVDDTSEFSNSSIIDHSFGNCPIKVRLVLIRWALAWRGNSKEWSYSILKCPRQ